MYKPFKQSKKLKSRALTILSSLGVDLDSHWLRIESINQTDVFLICAVLVRAHHGTMYPVRPVNEISKHGDTKHVGSIRNNNFSVTSIKVR